MRIENSEEFVNSPPSSDIECYSTRVMDNFFSVQSPCGQIAVLATPLGFFWSVDWLSRSLKS